MVKKICRSFVGGKKKVNILYKLEIVCVKLNYQVIWVGM